MSNAANTFAIPSDAKSGWKSEGLTTADMRDTLTRSGLERLEIWLNNSKAGDSLNLSDDGLPLVLVRE